MPQIRIANGQLFDPWNPKMKFISTEGSWNWLGHHLANECRYAGGCRWFYSVAQHSVLAERYVTQVDFDTALDFNKLRLAALLHDATESVLKDIPGPYKSTFCFAPYKALELSLGEWIYKQFGLGKEYLDAPPIKAIDKELLNAERMVLFPEDNPMRKDYPRGGIHIEPWDREYARDTFNRTLRSLTAS